MGFFKQKKEEAVQETVIREDKVPPHQSTTSLEKNIAYIKEEMRNSADLKIRLLPDSKQALIFLDDITDPDKMQRYIFEPLLKTDGDIRRIKDREESNDLNKAVAALIEGKAVYLVEGNATCYLFNVQMDASRTIMEPVNEKVIKGSHDGFNEDIKTNINLIRRRIQHRSLTVKKMTIGDYTESEIAMVYVDGVVNQDVVKELEKRISSINTDALLSAGAFTEYIEDRTYSIFPQFLSTERPDKTTALLMEGRIAILFANNPTCLIAPVTFFAFYQTPDDYNTRWIVATYLRLIRLFSFILSITLPSFYIAVIGFHYEVIPEQLISPVLGAIRDIAYPPLVEAVLMVIILEVIREAAIRLPSPIGSTIGIVGGLVIGDAIVTAGLVSNLMVIVIALTSLASYVVPSNEMSDALRLLTFPLCMMSAVLGFIGIGFGLLFLLIHLCRMESLGLSYFTPIQFRDIKDTIIRVPQFLMKRRPEQLNSPRPYKSNKLGENNGK
ncbi:spore germination protein [Terribacillus halophilus]|uniref:spore germination protein n=1 Tax=Terribacillus halophilus TaxID=361279 RepID=UPI0009870924|nr:spore germination protein [Terribacillus halophilus]